MKRTDALYQSFVEILREELVPAFDARPEVHNARLGEAEEARLQRLEQARAKARAKGARGKGKGRR